MRECEIKVPLTSSSVAIENLFALVQHGAEIRSARDELDVVLDTQNFAMRNAGLLFRYRRIIIDSKPATLITLKVSPSIKDQRSWYQEHLEIEFLASDKRLAKQKSDDIRKIIFERTGLKVPDLSSPGTLSDWWSRLTDSIGTPSIRSLVQKRRIVFAGCLNNQRWEACLDLFPDPVGPFLELETESPELLKKLLVELNIDQHDIDARTYGQIVGERTGASTGKSSRICVFPETSEEISRLIDRSYGSTTPTMEA